MHRSIVYAFVLVFCPAFVVHASPMLDARGGKMSKTPKPVHSAKPAAHPNLPASHPKPVTKKLSKSHVVHGSTSTTPKIKRPGSPKPANPARAFPSLGHFDHHGEILRRQCFCVELQRTSEKQRQQNNRENSAAWGKATAGLEKASRKLAGDPQKERNLYKYFTHEEVQMAERYYQTTVAKQSKPSAKSPHARDFSA